MTWFGNTLADESTWYCRHLKYSSFLQWIRSIGFLIMIMTRFSLKVTMPIKALYQASKMGFQQLWSISQNYLQWLLQSASEVLEETSMTAYEANDISRKSNLKQLKHINWQKWITNSERYHFEQNVSYEIQHVCKPLILPSLQPAWERTADCFIKNMIPVIK